MLDESKGQISVEYVLLLGLVLVLVLGVVTYFGLNNELNMAMSATREGVMDASNDLAYNGTGNVIRFNNMTFNDGNIVVNVYSKIPLNSTSLDYIQTKAINNLRNTLLNGNIQIVSSSDTSVQTNRYTYTVTVVNTA